MNDAVIVGSFVLLVVAASVAALVIIGRLNRRL